MNEPLVQTTRLTKRLGDILAVDELSLTVRRGEVYGFLGPNGAGKTTTLRMILGLIHPTSGSIEIMGGAPGDRDVMRRVGALIEGPGFNPFMSGRDNLRQLAAFRRLDAGVVDEALARVDLATRAGDRFRAYSLGMKQRLGVAAALMGDPDLVVLDEPTNGLDPAGMADMRRLLRALAAEGRTVIVSSHLMADVEATCDRVGVISHGRLLRESSIGDLRGARRVMVRATPLDRAIAVLMDLAGDDGVSVDGDRLIVDWPETDTARLTLALVTAGVEVREISASERTLEEAFLEMTSSPRPMETVR